jgi:large subunit ribosomal protein L22
MAVPETQIGVRAQAKWVRMSPRKARLVAEHIRGRTVPEARTILAFTDRAAARAVEKVLRSAVANAEANHGFAGDTLLVRAATVDEGPTIKRWRARARGRVARIRKRTCHITITLTPDGLEGATPARLPSTAAPVKAAEPVTPAPEAEATVEEKPKTTRKARQKKTEAAASPKTSRKKSEPQAETSSDKREGDAAKKPQGSSRKT